MEYTLETSNSKPCKRFLTVDEYRLLETLLEIKPKNTDIMVKPRLIDMVYCAEDRKGKYSILCMHVDYVLMKIPEYYPVLAIELDGGYHVCRYNNDKLKNEILLENGIPILRIQSQKKYDKKEVQTVLYKSIYRR